MRRITEQFIDAVGGANGMKIAVLLDQHLGPRGVLDLLVLDT